MSNNWNENPFAKDGLAEGKHLLTFKALNRKWVEFKGKGNNNMELVFLCPRTDKKVTMLVYPSLNDGTLCRETLIALAGGSLKADVLKDAGKVWKFIHSCIGAQYEVEVRLNEKGYSQIARTGKRPHITLYEGKTKVPEKVGNVEQTSLEDDDINF